MEELPPEKPGQAAEAPPEKTPKGFRSLALKLVEAYFEEHPIQRAVFEWLRKEGSGVRNGWFLFALFALMLVSVAAWGVHRIDAILADSAMSATNAIQQSKIETLTQKSQDLQRDKDELRQDRDTYKLAAQNADNALAPWKQLANNAYSDVPIQQRMDSLFQHVAALEASQPKFDVQVNELEVTNGTTITLEATREIRIKVRNTGENTASGITIVLSMPLASTNAICPGWSLGNGEMEDSATHQPIKGASIWYVVCDHRVPSQDGFPAPGFIISTNAPEPAISWEMMLQFSFGHPVINPIDTTPSRFLPAQLSVFSDNSKRQNLQFLLSY
jgi:hypothetical protein